MDTHVLTNDQLNDFLQDGDVLVNAGQEAIAAPVRAVSINSDGTARLINGPAYPVSTQFAAAVAALEVDDIQRFVVRGNPHDCQPFTDALTQADRTCIACFSEHQCDADAFMDEEDSEAVAERLRQLGYL